MMPGFADAKLDGLEHLAVTYPVETAWTPQYVGDELRQVRAAAWQARLAGLRAATDATAAARRGDHGQAMGKQALAASYHTVPGSRLRRPRPGVPALASTSQGRDPPAAQARDPALPQILQRAMDRDADWEAAD